MQLQVLKSSILLTLLSFSACSASSQGQAKLKPALPTNLTENLQVLPSVTESLKISLSTSAIRSCIENTQKLEDLQKSRASEARVLKFFESVLQSHKREKQTIKSRIEYFQSDCDNYGESCSSAEHHRKNYHEELKEERKTKMEVVDTINKSIALKRAEEAHSKTFDINCQEKGYAEMVVLKICRKSYSYEAPICRDFM